MKKTADLYRALRGRSPFDRLMESQLGQQLRAKAGQYRDAREQLARHAATQPSSLQVGRALGALRRTADQLGNDRPACTVHQALETAHRYLNEDPHDQGVKRATIELVQRYQRGGDAILTDGQVKLMAERLAYSYPRSRVATLMDEIRTQVTPHLNRFVASIATQDDFDEVCRQLGITSQSPAHRRDRALLAALVNAQMEGCAGPGCATASDIVDPSDATVAAATQEARCLDCGATFTEAEAGRDDQGLPLCPKCGGADLVNAEGTEPMPGKEAATKALEPIFHEAGVPAHHYDRVEDAMRAQSSTGTLDWQSRRQLVDMARNALSGLQGKQAASDSGDAAFYPDINEQQPDAIQLDEADAQVKAAQAVTGQVEQARAAAGQMAALQGRPRTAKDEVMAKDEVLAKDEMMAKDETMGRSAVTPPGISEKTMHELKRDKSIDNPWAVAWSIHNKQKRHKSMVAELQRLVAERGLPRSPYALLALKADLFDFGTRVAQDLYEHASGEADEELAESVEHLVNQHMRDNQEQELSEGHRPWAAADDNGDAPPWANGDGNGGPPVGDDGNGDVTDDQIHQLMHEAQEAGDYQQVQLCQQALAGDPDARAACADAIASAAAMGNGGNGNGGPPDDGSRDAAPEFEPPLLPLSNPDRPTPIERRQRPVETTPYPQGPLHRSPQTAPPSRGPDISASLVQRAVLEGKTVIVDGYGLRVAMNRTGRAQVEMAGPDCFPMVWPLTKIATAVRCFVGAVTHQADWGDPKVNTQQPDAVKPPPAKHPIGEGDSSGDDVSSVEPSSINEQVDALDQPGSSGTPDDMSGEEKDGLPDPGTIKQQHPATDQAGVSLPDTDLGPHSSVGEGFDNPTIEPSSKEARVARIVKITDAATGVYEDSGQPTATVSWVDHRGQTGTTSGHPEGGHMQALLQRAVREGVKIGQHPVATGKWDPSSKEAGAHPRGFRAGQVRARRHNRRLASHFQPSQWVEQYADDVGLLAANNYGPWNSTEDAEEKVIQAVHDFAKQKAEDVIESFDLNPGSNDLKYMVEEYMMTDDPDPYGVEGGGNGDGGFGFGAARRQAQRWSADDIIGWTSPDGYALCSDCGSDDGTLQPVFATDEVPLDWTCDKCHERIIPWDVGDTVQCGACNSTNYSDSDRCMNCGAPLDKPADPDENGDDGNGNGGPPEADPNQLNLFGQLSSTDKLAMVRQAMSSRPFQAQMDDYDDMAGEPDLLGDPEEPQEDDWGTEDHRHFYEFGGTGRHVLEVPAGASEEEMWQALEQEMGRQGFYPNVWFVSDHGNAHLMKRNSARTAARQSMTFGQMPSKEEWDEAFDQEVPSGRYQMDLRGSDARACDDAGIDWYDGMSSDDLYVMVKKLADDGGDETGMLASDIMTTLGFEWI